VRAQLRALIFDFDGLIIDTETPVFDAWQQVYAELEQVLALEVWQQGVGTHRGFDPCAHLEELVGRPLDREAVRDRAHALNRAHHDLLPLLPGVERLIDDARERSLARAVASSSSSGWVTGWLERHRLSARIDVVCARDDVERVKPDPALFLLAAQRLGVPPAQALVFEDSPNGVRAARAAGMRVVVVPNCITGSLAFPEHDARFDSLAQVDLEILAARLRMDLPRAGGATHQTG
jgi:HAD superfamily hydrolase (TIGR01509 family)